MFWSVNRGSTDAIFGISVWGGHHGKWWHSWFVMPLYGLASRLDRAIWWVRYRVEPKHRYHVVNTGLEPGCWDEDTLMLNACFVLLGSYIKQMGGIEKIEEFNIELGSDEHGSGQAQRQAEAVALWRWWTVKRPADLKREEELLHLCYGGGYKLTSIPTDNPKLRQVVFPERSAESQQLADEHRALELLIHEEEQSMLHRLIDIRSSLWV